MMNNTRNNFRWEYENITLTRGDTFSFGLELYDDEGAFIDYDLDMCSFKVEDNDTKETLYEKTLSNGVTKLASGQYIVRVAPEDTDEAEAGRYFYELKIGVDGDVFTLYSGIISYDYEGGMG